jgi:signal transduction histidine kinase
VGDLAGGDAPSHEDGAREAVPQHDVARIADAVRESVDARAALISRVVDDDWLEIVAVSGETSGSAPTGSRWPRADLARYLDDAERRGRIHVTKRRAVSYVEVPDGAPFAEGDPTILVAPLHTNGGDLVGVLTTVGYVDVDQLPPGACDLVELYADQARLALDLLREHHLYVEHLRLSDTAESLMYLALEQPDVTSLLDAVSAPVAAMMGASAVWTCAEIASGAHAEAASYPDEVAGRLGADICTLVEPMVATCWTDDTTLTDEDSPLLGRIAGLAHQQRALLAAIGSGSTARGALLVLRSADHQPWTEREREALAGLGRRLGSVVEQLEARRRDRHLVAELRELDQYRRDLVASLTHDLKTPLTAIALNAELLESDRRLAEAGSHPVAAIRRSAERLSSLVDDLLALARAEEGLELTGGPDDSSDGVVRTDAVALVRDACRHAEVEAHQRGLRFVLDLPETLPIGVDGSALARVYVNVVDNAVKFSLPDGEVRISLRAVGGQVEMMCADDGVGISEADQATVFDMFRRARESGARGVPGSGVGLAISQRIVTRLGGSIDLDSKLGEGSTFVVRVPSR